MNHTISCRIASYGKFQERGWSHLPEIGVTNVEIPVPKADEFDAIQAKLKKHGLTATSLQGSVDINAEDAVAVMTPQLETCKKMGTRFCFLSVKAGDGDKNAAYSKLKQIGDVAKANDVTVVLETHPDLITNGDIAAQTMKAVSHPNVLVNYDTANVHYYNEGVDSVEELKKVIDYLGAVHLKDSGGGFKEWHFPTLGEGVVDFPKVFELLDAKGFTGPYTMELEGVRGVEFDEQGQCDYIAKSVDYLKQIGAM